jgi:hypothetical protein
VCGTEAHTAVQRRGVRVVEQSFACETKKGRHAPRFAVSLGVVLSTGEAYYFIETQDVSEKGLCLRPKKVFSIGSQHRMVLGRPPQLPRIDMVGVVRWSEAGRGVGVEFISISAHDQRTLREFLNSHS